MNVAEVPRIECEIGGEPLDLAFGADVAPFFEDGAPHPLAPGRLSSAAGERQRHRVRGPRVQPHGRHAHSDHPELLGNPQRVFAPRAIDDDAAAPAGDRHEIDRAPVEDDAERIEVVRHPLEHAVGDETDRRREIVVDRKHERRRHRNTCCTAHSPRQERISRSSAAARLGCHRRVPSLCN